MSSLVVADSGPIHYLAEIGHADLLQHLFDVVVVPGAVLEELTHQNTPAVVRNWVTQPKPWLRIQSAQSTTTIPQLHPGEREAIQLALELRADGVLVDDLEARIAARQRGLNVIGTVGILERAAEKNLIQLPTAIQALRQTNIFVAEPVLQNALERDRVRRQLRDPEIKR